ncbi:unnamed protein product, partial [Heligmosomoides polygyrus]|uniref:RMI1_N domain-containing protein n=1 Tax=Heligmosomoides polygyrus TaxID=6339 RepID=A0A183F2E7_HELPZ
IGLLIFNYFTTRNSFRNVSQPKVREDAQSNDDVARLSLTDGHTSVSALLLDNFKGLSSDTPPGTKLLITGAVPIECGFVLLSPKNVTVVGGRVDSLIEKWTIERVCYSIGFLVLLALCLFALHL